VFITANQVRRFNIATELFECGSVVAMNTQSVYIDLFAKLFAVTQSPASALFYSLLVDFAECCFPKIDNHYLVS